MSLSKLKYSRLKPWGAGCARGCNAAAHVVAQVGGRVGRGGGGVRPARHRAHHRDRLAHVTRGPLDHHLPAGWHRLLRLSSEAEALHLFCDTPAESACPWWTTHHSQLADLSRNYTFVSNSQLASAAILPVLFKQTAVQ